jgi:very-short-patch-repair endonuclease
MPSTFARQLRSTATDAEIRLWSRLRRKQLNGFRFRRQHPIGAYIVDFFCPEAKLIVEVDGGQHNVEEEKDEKRTSWLEERGYRVIRFWNNDVLSNPMAWCLRCSKSCAVATPLPTLPLKGGGAK